MEFKRILSSKWPFGRFMHSLCKNENIPLSGESDCYITEENAFHLTRIKVNNAFLTALRFILFEMLLIQNNPKLQ